MLIFLKNNETIILYRNQNILLIFLGPTMIDLDPTYSYSKMRNQGYVVL